MLIKVKPKDGLTVVHPETGFALPGETMIEKSPAVIRLLKDGDILEVKDTPSKKSATKDGDK